MHMEDEVIDIRKLYTVLRQMEYEYAGPELPFQYH